MMVIAALSSAVALPFVIGGSVLQKYLAIGTIDTIALVIAILGMPVLISEFVTKKRTLEQEELLNSKMVPIFIASWPVTAFAAMKLFGPLPIEYDPWAIINLNGQFAQFCAFFVLCFPVVSLPLIVAEAAGLLEPLFKITPPPLVTIEQAGPMHTVEARRVDHTGMAFDPDRFR